MKKDWTPVIVVIFWILLFIGLLWVGSQPGSQPNTADPQCSQIGNC